MEPAGAPPSRWTHLRDLTREELRAWARDVLGEPPYRGSQIFAWLYRRRVRDFAAMTDLSRELRARLPEVADVAEPEVAAAPKSKDGTRKLLLRLGDGAEIESVVIPDEDRATLCVSTQVGCALACAFCATGTMGFSRNLLPHEIVDQFLTGDRYAREDFGRPLTNVVLMGMGEPLLNYEATKKALAILADPEGIGLSRRRVTLSTVGIVPRMLPFIEETGANLAVSLHAPDEALRRELMPVSRAHSLDDVLAALRANADALRDRVTFEYVLLAGVNDSLEQARALAALVRGTGIPAKVNLLAYNPHEGAPFRRPDEAAVDRFRRTLVEGGVDAYVRRSRGLDVDAACGQLAVKARPTVSPPPRTAPTA